MLYRLRRFFFLLFLYNYLNRVWCSFNRRFRENFGWGEGSGLFGKGQASFVQGSSQGKILPIHFARKLYLSQAAGVQRAKLPTELIELSLASLLFQARPDDL